MTSNFNPVLPGHTALFPCSANVHIPNYGAENFKVKPVLGSSKMHSHYPLSTVTQDVNPASEKYIKMISNSLTFTEDVIENRCLHMMPYDEKYFHGIFEPGKLISSHKQIKYHGRHKTKSKDGHHIANGHKIVVKPNQLESLKRSGKSTDNQLHRSAQLASKNAEEKHHSECLSTLDSSPLFMTEIGSVGTFPKIINDTEQKMDASNFAQKKTIKLKHLTSEMSKQTAPMNQNVAASVKASNLSIMPDSSEERQNSLKFHKRDWDDHLLSKLSQLTANWIVHTCMPADDQKEKLVDVLTSWYGHTKHTDLVREDISDSEEEDRQKNQKHNKKWKKTESSVLAKVYNITPPPAAAVDPYSDDNQAPFYRQPTGIRKKKKNRDKEDAGEINTTAHNIQVQGYLQTPLPKLKDFLNPKVGDKIYDTDNLYQQEWLTGKSHVFNGEDTEEEIIMETDNKYRKQLQQEMPLKPDVWYASENSDQAEQKVSSRRLPLHKPKKGWKRWIDLPQPVNDAEQLMITASSEINPTTIKTADSKQRQKIRQNHALVSIVLDWRGRWFMSGRYADSTPDDLIKDMADIQPHVRLKAIGTLAKAAEYSNEDSSDGASVQELPEKIFIALECLLDDSHQQVRKAAAVAMYSLDRPTDKAQEILKEMLSDNEADRWASVQCLSHYGTCDSDVVTEIIKQILTTESAIKYEQGIHLLARISANTNIVHCIVAEQLNSSNWRHRVIACKILPTLSGSINRDITHKLTDLMWHDWHAEVRNAAAQCLGKTSHGQDVHNSIIEQLLHGTERTKLEAISKLGQLGIMTAKLLPAFLQCFTSSSVSIRCEICITCGNLQINEEQVVQQLVHLATSDPSWRVKALAIQALGKIGTVDDEIKECLFWAVRFEDKPGVRAQACHSIVALNIRDEDIIETLQERLLVESSAMVGNEISEALILFGVSATDDTEMVAQIKSEVCKLGHRNIIASEIIVNEAEDSNRAHLKKMKCLTEEDIKALDNRKAAMLQHIQFQISTLKHSCSSRLKMSTPLPSTTPEPVSREGTEFTLAADKELEALLSHRSESCSLSSKSRPVTKQSLVSDEADLSRSEQELEVHSIFQSEMGDEDKKSNVSGRETDVTKIREETQKSEKLLYNLSLPPLIQPAFGKNIASSYSRSAYGLITSRLSPLQLHSHRSVRDKDLLKEEEKFNQEVSTVFSELDVRYTYLNEDLMKIDKGYNTRDSLDTGDLKRFSSAEELQLVNEKTQETMPNPDKTITTVSNSETETQECLLNSDETCTEEHDFNNLDTSILELVSKDVENITAPSNSHSIDSNAQDNAIEK